MRVIESMDITVALSAEVSQQFDQAQLDAESATNTALLLTNISIALAIATGIIASILLTKMIAKPLHKLEDYVQEITKGNLKIEPISINSNDEIGHLATAMNEMKATLSNLLFSLSDNAGHLSATSEELMASVEEVHAASEVTLGGAKEGAQSSLAMATAASESAIAMDETATTIQRIAESSQELHRFASNSEEIAVVGTQNIHTASNQMTSIFESTKLTTELIHKLSLQSQEIESITQVITGISDQTNLLALNAAIEAVRVGEHGKGFAVVADEVRKLAEESNRSASKIGTLTNEIQRDTKNVELAIQESLHNVEKGVGIIDRAGDSFDQIANAIGNMKVQIEDVSAVTEQISATAEEVAASVTEISRAADRTNASANDAYLSSGQQLSALTEVSSVANDLSNRAQESQKVVSNYRL